MHESSARALTWQRCAALGSMHACSSTHTSTLHCAGPARGRSSLTRRALLWAAGCCLRGIALEVDGLACVLGQAGEPGPAAGGAAGDLADLGGRDALVLEVRRIALLPCGGEP